jgi:N-glycosidase YbiA
MYPSHDQQLSYETEDTVYWFSHAFDPLNNWSAHMVKIWGQNFPTVEHAFHYRKFSDTVPEIAMEIVESPSPYMALRIARDHKDRRRTDWSDVKVGIMTEIVRVKVVQNEDARVCLLATGDKKLVENSPVDCFWGTGKDGTGQNMMGGILMKIRTELRSSNA